MFFLGLASSAIFAPLFFFPSLFCITILVYLVKYGKDVKYVLLLGLIFGFGHFLSGLYWVAIAPTTYDDTLSWMVPIALVGLPFILSFFIALACACSWYYRFSENFTFAFTSFWVIFEWLRSWLFTGFAWNLTGYAMSFSAITIQTASIWGVYGLSFILIYTASGYHILFENKKSTLHTHIVFTLLLTTALLIFGYYRLKLYSTKFENINIRVVQPSIIQNQKWDSNQFWTNLKKYIDLSKIPADKDSDIIIWPEAAVTVPLHIKSVQDFISYALVKPNSILITGGIDEIENPEYKVYTSMYAIQKDSKLLFIYHKQHLVPFGEYIPFKQLLPLTKITHGVIDYSQGQTVKVFELPNYKLKIRPLICYEVIFPNEVAISNKDVDLIINVTNDSWYGHSSGPYQHLHITIMRAVENGIPIVRAANNGISAIIDPNGKIIQQTKLDQVTIIDSKLPKKLNFSTIYSYFKMFSIIFLIIFLNTLKLISKNIKNCLIIKIIT